MVRSLSPSRGAMLYPWSMYFLALSNLNTKSDHEESWGKDKKINEPVKEWIFVLKNETLFLAEKILSQQESEIQVNFSP